jgi:hypothetical protein
MAPKVTINHEGHVDTPSKRIISDANKAVAATDATGRLIGVRKMLPLDRMRMFEVVGSENAKNEPYLGYAALAFHVSSIDGDAVAQPATKRQLEALIQRLGDDGLNAVGKLLEEQFSPEASEAAVIEQIKN